MTKKKPKQKLKITFHHVKAKNEEERLDQVRRVEETYDILFTETVKKLCELEGIDDEKYKLGLKFKKLKGID